jgi:flagellin-like hook-associated protein FlgL
MEVENTEAKPDPVVEAQEAAAGLNAGFEKVRPKAITESPDATPKTEQTAIDPAAVAKAAEDKKAEEAAAQAAAAEAEKERERVYFESLPASVRQQHESLAKLPDRLRNIEGHIGGLKSAVQAAAEASKTATAAGKEAPTQEQVAAAGSSGPKWEKMKEDFPDWAEAFEERIAAQAANAPKGAAVDVEGLRKDISGEVSGALDAAEERAVLRIKHPDWKTKVNTPDFKAWTLAGGPSVEEYATYKSLDKTDPAKAQEMKQGFATKHKAWWDEKGASMFSASADDAAKLLDGFDAHTKAAATAAAKKGTQQSRLERAIPVRGSGAPPAPSNDDANAFRNGFNKVRGVKA